MDFIEPSRLNKSITARIAHRKLEIAHLTDLSECPRRNQPTLKKKLLFSESNIKMIVTFPTFRIWTGSL